MAAEQQNPEEPDQRSYQRALRVIGRYLDSEPSYHISISEVADGFTVRSHSTTRLADERVMHFEWSYLDNLDKFHTGNRGLKRRQSRHEGLWEHFPCGHEAALRKLGSILDTEGATSLSVDEVEGGIDVTFMKGPPDGPQLDRTQRVFTPDDLC